jgi:hypothetical protein
MARERRTPRSELTRRLPGKNSSAFGEGAHADFVNSAAFGAGATVTRVNQVVIGTANNTYTLPGITFVS